MKRTGKVSKVISSLIQYSSRCFDDAMSMSSKRSENARTGSRRGVTTPRENRPRDRASRLHCPLHHKRESPRHVSGCKTLHNRFLTAFAHRSSWKHFGRESTDGGALFRVTLPISIDGVTRVEQTTVESDDAGTKNSSNDERILRPG